MTTANAHLNAQYAQHVKKLRQIYDGILGEYHQYSGILIDSGFTQMQFLDDQAYPFKTNPHFKHWVPLTKHPQCFLWIRREKTPVLFYFRKEDFWHKMPDFPQGFWLDHFDVQIIADAQEVPEKIGTELKQSLYIGNFYSQLQSWGINHCNDSQVLNEIHFARTIKSEYEMTCLQRASERGAFAHKVALQCFEQGLSELEIHLEYLKATQCAEEEQPYSNIVAINQNAAILHYTDYHRQRPSTRHSFLIDAGAGFHGYAADITRTYAAVPGEFDNLIQALEKKVQMAIMKDLKVGDLYADLHQRAHHLIAEILHDFSFVHMPAPEIVEKKISHSFFPHGLGHLLGLQVHDVGGHNKDEKGKKNTPPVDHPYLRLTSQLAPGHVFTVEPGLYFIAPLLDKLRQSEHKNVVNWRKIEAFMVYGGIRIEDNIALTENGSINFTRKAFDQLNEKHERNEKHQAI